MPAGRLSRFAGLGLGLGLLAACATASDGGGRDADAAAAAIDGGKSDGDGGALVDAGFGRVDAGPGQRCGSNDDCTMVGFCCFKQDGALSGTCTEGVIEQGSDRCLPI